MFLVIKNESGNTISKLRIKNDEVVLNSLENCFIDNTGEFSDGEMIFEIQIINSKNLENYSLRTLLEEIENRCVK